MQSFEVHSNESTCRKSGRPGLEQVIYYNSLKIFIKGKPTLILKSIATINHEMGWFEILRYNNNKAATISNLLETTWLDRYHLTIEMLYDCGAELLGSYFKTFY